MSLDPWAELLERLNRHRFRTALTMLSVGWGILMLVLLLGAGEGLENNLRAEFRTDVINSVWMRQGRTSMPYEGHATGRRVRLTNADHALVEGVPGVEQITSRYHMRGSAFTVSWRDRHAAFQVLSVHPTYRYLDPTDITRGRFLNELDIEERRKVAVIGEEVGRFLFRGTDPMGEYIRINGIQYIVVGTFRDAGGPDQERRVFVPISTAQVAYGAGEQVHQILFTVGEANVDESIALTEQIRGLLAERHRFDPEDHRAVRISNNLERYEEIASIFRSVRAFVWIVGIGTVFAGIVGVSNIMLVSVKERTAEIGLRKALGATPASIVGMILRESVVLTSIAGYAGVVLGVALLEVVARTVPENDYLLNPAVDLGVVLLATGLIIAFGTLAGLFPALQAARVDPIVALRDEA